MKTVIKYSFTYEGEKSEGEYTAPGDLRDEEIILIVKGLLFEANWAGDTKFENFEINATFED